ncbi:hypothetical protein EQ718_25925 (plasmid) [Paracoccus versutus]|uniref:Uncharacterized protein n=1 Tax=Paracoccus versutus TaxID=34007 RepID=A0AAQ0HIR2_PARVE|nr:hypothetical protein [Paracoccus versutus]KGJ11028.1 hypothetical protein IT40_09395 [Paracoccus versutus]REG47005.1 hypothetical protein ATH84_101223 [Paracoccus versutus]WEJ82222.1 hypothetical protein EQ718_25925 [Paracoccus versutus]
MNQQNAAMIEAPADPAELFDTLYRMGLTDGMPVIPPTDDLVQRFIAASGRPGSDEIAVIPPANHLATVTGIAVNAVMAGCLPEYMPVLIAVVEALVEPQFNLFGVATTTNPVGPLILVNGPVRQQLDLNCGRNALGPGRRANATIGRAIRLIMLNIGGAIPEEVDKATLGQPGKYTMCLGEAEEESPWVPLHVERGFEPEDSTVTVVGVQDIGNMFVCFQQAESILRTLASGMVSFAANNMLLGEGNPILFLNPGHADLLAKQGYDKPRIREELFRRATFPASELPQEVSAVEQNSRNIIDGRNMVTARAEDILIAVAGGPEAYHNSYCATFGNMAVTKKIRLP